MNVLTQPYKRPRATADDNFLATLDQPYDLAAAVTRDGGNQVNLAAFLRAHPSGQAPVWALANNNVGPRVWNATSPGDLVLFYGYREVFAYGVVTSKVYWPDNDNIWPTGTDWDFVYSLRDFHHLPQGERPSTDLLRPALGRFSAQSAQLHKVEERGTTAAQVFAELFQDLSLPAAEAALPSLPPAPRPQVARPALPSSGPIGGTDPDPLFTQFNSASDAVAANWQARERGTLAHQQLVFQLGQLISAQGYTPRYGVPQLNFDMSWSDGTQTYIVEVKSLSAHNQADQIRLGLGQILDYRWTHRAAQPSTLITAVLVTELEPADSRWSEVCSSAGVLLTWPNRMATDLGL